MSISVEQANRQLRDLSAEEILVWARDTFTSNIAMSSSFQTQSLPLLHIVSRVAPELEILFLDTGFHFPETLAFRDRLIREWELNVRTLRRDASGSGEGGPQTAALYRTDPDLCCHINKVEPMGRAMEGLEAWISGIRRDQSKSRQDIATVERTPEGVVRIHPMATWTSEDIDSYIDEHELPEHPLAEKGYISVGCAPCTRRPTGLDSRSGRWTGHGKTECGLHTELRGTEQGPVSISARRTKKDG